MSTQPQSPDDDLGIAPGILRSMQAYWRDLPQLLLLRSRKRVWVAYHGDERVGFGRSRADLYDECMGRGLARGEFYVGMLEASTEPPWEPIDVETGYGPVDDGVVLPPESP
jgi:hypothetical protein